MTKVKRGLLVRIGVDQAYGGWNAPVDAEGRFVYVPIPESLATTFHPQCERPYSRLRPALDSFCAQRGHDLRSELKCPQDLLTRSMHLDPDFEKMTYGDEGGRRGAGMVGMTDGDLLVFYAGLRPTQKCEHKLIYALVGVYVVQEVVSVGSIPTSRWDENAHTRKIKRGETDIVVRAKAGVSGRLERCIPIGEWRSRSYRVRQDVLDQWGGLNVKDGFIQRSAVPPSFTDPSRFYEWFLMQGVSLVPRNN